MGIQALQLKTESFQRRDGLSFYSADVKPQSQFLMMTQVYMALCIDTQPIKTPVMMVFELTPPELI